MSLRVGIDLVQVSRVAESMAAFGDRFARRVFTDDELAYARTAASPDDVARRLAARFAAKEAAKKALRLDGVGWRDIEVTRAPSGAVELALHGAAARIDTDGLAVSLSHEGDWATAVVVTQVRGTNA